MTSKTFKSAFDDSSYRLEVCKNAGAEHISLWILGGGSDSASIAVAHKDIPALALAILEAAGYKEEQGNETTEAAHHFGMSMLHLRYGIKEQEYITAEAEVQAKLEAEAVELRNAYHKGIGYSSKDWSHLNDEQKEVWLAVARRAREMRAEK